MSHTQIADIRSHQSTASLKHLPINLYASVMGVSGLVLAWRQASQQFGVSPLISETLGIGAVVIFLILSMGYLTKAIRYPEVVKQEFNHPVTGNFFGTVTIAILLISSVIAPLSHVAATIIWSIGALLTIALAFIIVNRLLQGGIDPALALPVWLIPSVGTLDIAVAGGSMPMVWARELNLFALAVGTVLALVFLTLILSRLMHQPQPATQMLPSMMILMAPFAVGFLAYRNFTGQIDLFAGLLFYFGLFLFLVIAFKLWRNPAPFSAGWWAISFPLAALANAALAYAHHVQMWPITLLALLLLLVLSMVIVVLAVRTVHILANGSLLSV